MESTLATPSLTSDGEEFDLYSESTWTKLYPFLESLARYFVYSSKISSWQGQEKDIIGDIVQETGRRLIERSQKVTRGEVQPTLSLKSMLYTIIHNYCEDLRRRDRRLLHEQPEDAIVRVNFIREAQMNVADVGTENVYREEIFKLIAHEVAAFPYKQCQAVLIDLANRMHFGSKPTPLQQAFLDEGIQLRTYRQVLPANPRERGRHAALVSSAYKRIASSPQMQSFIAHT